MYCEVRTRTHWTGVHSISFWKGRSVVSVWKTLPSTCPLRIAERSSDIGKRGFVTVVDRENGAATRSRRALRGASGRSPSPAATSCALEGCGTEVATLGRHARPELVVAALVAYGTAHLAATTRRTRKTADVVIVRLPIPPPPSSLFNPSHTRGGGRAGRHRPARPVTENCRLNQ